VVTFVRWVTDCKFNSIVISLSKPVGLGWTLSEGLEVDSTTRVAGAEDSVTRTTKPRNEPLAITAKRKESTAATDHLKDPG